MYNEQHPLLKTLNVQQRAAVTAPDGPVLVLAGPGSGKTRVLLHRVAWMLQEEHAPPWQVLSVTFTNKAAREMRERLNHMLDYNATQDMTLGTFHATCARILRREAEAVGLSSDYLIFDTDDQLAVMKDVVKTMGLDDKKYRPRALLSAVSHAKNELIEPRDYPIQTYYDEIVSRAYVQYQDILRRSNGVDFDDLLMEIARLFRTRLDILEKYQARYRYILVDEFQDTNMAQYVILRLLSQQHQSLFVVADEDQSIYSWRGADYRNIQRLREEYSDLREFLLEENYRSTQIILDGAQAVIAQNFDRTPKQLFTRHEGGDLIRLHEAYDEMEEADYVAREINTLFRMGYQPQDIAVMYRTNAQSRALEETLIRYNIPYRLVGATRFYARKEIRDVLAFLRLAQNPDDNVSFQRVVNTPTRGIGARTVAKVIEQAHASEVSYYQAALMVIQQGILRTRTHRALQAFLTLVKDWQKARDVLSVAALMDEILDTTGYEKDLRDGSEEGESRWENILALRAVATDFPDKPLVEFLTDVALVSDVDDLAEELEAVTLLTLHSAKGLEYPIVFVTGLEEGLLPHSRSMDSEQEIAEERRLCYVGMTRAEKRLYLTYAFRRSWGYYGSSEPSRPSRFLEDLPDEVLKNPRRANKKPREDRNPGWRVSSWGKTQGRKQQSHSRIKQTQPARAPTYTRGQRVRHVHYGEGMVLDTEMDRQDELVTVIFAGVGIKQLLVGVAPLEPLSQH